MRRARCRAPFRGTYRYASLDAMKYREQAPKDDVESWLYLLVEWTSGKLPWRRLEMPDDRDEIIWWKGQIRHEKKHIFLKGCPKRTFSKLLSYVVSLQRLDIVDYNYISNILRLTAQEHGVKLSGAFEFQQGCDSKQTSEFNSQEAADL